MKKAIILFYLGGPDKLENVEPFLFNLFNDPAILNLPTFIRFPLAKLISNRRAPTAKKIYQELGGSSPILRLTEEQSKALEIKLNQPILFLPSDHLIPQKEKFNKLLFSNLKNLHNKNIFIFGIKPKAPRSDYGYLLNKKINKDINKVINFIEKPKENLAIKLIKNKALWNSGIVLARKDSIINNAKRYQNKLFLYCLKSLNKVNQNQKKILLNKFFFNKIVPISFDYAILEKVKEINSIYLNITWSDLGSWSEIFKILKSQINLNLIKKNTFYRPWGFYKNYFRGEKFLLKELIINRKSSISLQKHHHRAEHWTVTSGRPKITINKKVFFKDINESVYIPRGAIHRIENIYKKPVKIVEAQLGNILKESDIVRYKDIYGRVN